MSEIHVINGSTRYTDIYSIATQNPSILKQYNFTSTWQGIVAEGEEGLRRRRTARGGRGEACGGRIRRLEAADSAKRRQRQRRARGQHKRPEEGRVWRAEGAQRQAASAYGAWRTVEGGGGRTRAVEGSGG
ncbi:hypothetical protein DENSPDRAFT_875855, partial [Dentipellis sp. KUC8613]